MNKEDFDFWAETVRVVVNNEQEYEELISILKVNNQKIDQNIYFDKHYNSICLFNSWSNYKWNKVRDKKPISIKTFKQLISNDAK